MASAYGILQELDRGFVEGWADLCEYTLSRDLHISAVLGTRKARAVASAYQILPAETTDPAKTGLADAAAAFISDRLSAMSGLRQTFFSIMDALVVGFSAHEIQWILSGNECVPESITWVHPRRFRYDDEWNLRLYDSGARKPSTGGGEMTGVGEALLPDRWLVHYARSGGGYPSTYGLMRSLIWKYIEAHQVDKSWIFALERHGQPLLTTTVPKNTTSAIKEQQLRMLQNLSYDSVAVFEEGATINVVGGPAAIGNGATFEAFLKHTHDEITVFVLGASDLVNPGINGSQAAVGTRLSATADIIRDVDAMNFWDTLQAQLFLPMLRYNTHLFGGVIPPVPYGRFEYQLEQAAPVEPPQPSFSIATTDATVQIPSTPITGKDLMDAIEAKASTPASTITGKDVMDAVGKLALDKEPVVSSLTRSGVEQRKRTTSKFEYEFGDELDLDMADYIEMSAPSRGAYRKNLGKPEALTRSATSKLAKELGSSIETLGSKIGKCESESDAANVIHEMRESFISADAKALVWQSVAKSLMSGQMAVHAYDVGVASAFSTGGKPFLQRPWEEAIAEFQKQPFYNERTFQRIISLAVERGAVFEDSMMEQLQEKVRALVTTAMEEGTTFKEFGESLSDYSTSLGIDPPNPSYLKMAFRTNINSAYSAGRKEAIEEIKDERPYWRFMSVRDGNVRHTHAMLHGATFRVGNPDTDRLMPTLDFNCRCVAVSVKDPGDSVVYTDSSKFLAAINPEFSK
jgi:SPP1 gp7 family putative phage head morphogenesis protein